MTAMPATQTATVTGFVMPALGRSRTWHAKADCAKGPRAGQRPVTGANWVQLSHEQTRRGRTPCLVCALTVVIDDCQSRAAGPGSHALTCGDGYAHYSATHYYRPGEAPACDVCTTLTAYAHTNNTLVAAAGNRVSLLMPGTLPEAGRALFGTLVVGDNAAGTTTDTVTAAVWKTAAELNYGPITLEDALHAANAVHGPRNGRSLAKLSVS